MKSITSIIKRKKIDLKIDYSIFYKKKILITGSEGSIGKRIFKKLKKYTKSIYCVDIQDDVTKFKNIKKINKTRYDFIFHLAADKRADYGESNPFSVTSLNVISTFNISKLNCKKIILGSTCKAADPITSYGASKLISERIILNAGGNVARFVNVFDTSKSVTKTWKKIKKNQSIPVTPCKRYFISLEEAVNLLLFTASMPTGRYSYRNLRLISMKDIAKKIYPNRKIVKMDLRFGDRLNERLVGNSENVKVINKEIIKIQDCWGI
jgi:UDP-N-acetylglucosamine 4,6-dehydratase